jgi:hypothetical protein
MCKLFTLLIVIILTASPAQALETLFKLGETSKKGEKNAALIVSIEIELYTNVLVPGKTVRVELPLPEKKYS